MAFRKGKFQSAHVREPSIFLALKDLLDHLGESIQSKAVNLGWLTGRNYLFVRSPIRNSHEEEERGKLCDRFFPAFSAVKAALEVRRESDLNFGRKIMPWLFSRCALYDHLFCKVIYYLFRNDCPRFKCVFLLWARVTITRNSWQKKRGKTANPGCFGCFRLFRSNFKVWEWRGFSPRSKMTFGLPVAWITQKKSLI